MARIDPEVVVGHFSKLVYLRSIQDQSAMLFTDDAYARQIVKSWQQEDEEGMPQFIEELPAERERNALARAVKKLNE